MSRFTAQAPFTPNAAFVAMRRITLASRNYVPGDNIDRTKIPDRLLRTLYEQRKIGYGPEVIEAIEATSGKATETEEEAAARAEAERIAAETAEAERLAAEQAAAAAAGGDTVAGGADTTAPAAPRFKAKNAGFGGFKVIDTVTKETVASHETMAEAQADAEARNAPAATE